MCFKKNRNEVLGRIEKYRILSVHTNAAYKIPLENQFIFLKIYSHKHPRLNYEIRKFLGCVGLRQPVEYSSPTKRKAFEEETLKHWAVNGCNVPAIVDNPLPELYMFPILTTKFIDGITLRELICKKAIGAREKEEKLGILFCEVANRHHKAFLNNDNRLFHIDANTRNIIFADKAIYHVDFEMGRPWESVMACASREVLKLLVSIAEDMQPSLRKSAFQIFKDCYKKDDVYQFIRKGIIQRPFQRIHQFRNMRKKKKNPESVTLYDILHYLF